MKTIVLALLASTLLAAAEAPPKEEWSETVNGLRGRLVIGYDPDFVGTEMAVVYLEIQNVSDSASPQELWFGEDHQFKWQLQDEKYQFVPESHPGASILSPLPYWIVLPYDSTLRLRVSVSGYGISRNGGVALQLPGAFWQFKRPEEGSYYLSAQFTIVPKSDKKPRAWKGTLMLPAVAIPPKAKPASP